ncbi:uncharacterized protein LOC124293993 [Neodiprion lecontei]|uniref:Uncharacterized protein LOC124293993 n=1 Tax=Neodiprion lecontei TaxID=441921 RepID=A0ABM3FYY0_NEOLC|nr:uncharacterized protein LOC124293993 [Neodiprion lecontei]XP_046593216.1 uncharacterized protein LOC124293993 [Neodiprion lecontei]
MWFAEHCQIRISLILSHSISDNPIISRFFRGIYRNQPSKTKYESTWDTEPVLDLIESLQPECSLTSQQMAEKTATLLALITAHRLQTFELIDIDNISVSSAGNAMEIPDLIKTSRPGRFKPSLVLPFFNNRPVLCTAMALLDNVNFTERLKGDCKKLEMKRPYKPVGAQTISRWIRAFIQKAGVNTAVFSGYRARHASLFADFRNGVDVGIIRRTAGWTQG